MRSVLLFSFASIATLAALVAATACGSSAADSATVSAADSGGGPGDTTDGGGVDEASDAPAEAGPQFPTGAPITTTPGQWNWVDFPDAVCDDGTPTGIGVYPSATSDKLVFFFNGGGACWDFTTCVTLPISTHGPFGANDFNSAKGGLTGTILDPAKADNPFKDWNMVFVPYCTSDVHAGDAVQTYTSGSESKTFHHKGRANVIAYLARLSQTFTTPSMIAVTGSSAGGGGALFNYPSFKHYWPTQPMMMVDDSLPLFKGDAVAKTLRDGWYASWNMGPITDPICPTCRDDLSAWMQTMATTYPSDPMALLSSQQDGTIRQYYQISGAQFQTDLADLSSTVLEPTGHFKQFVVTGATHTMLGNPTSFTAGTDGGTTPLLTWLNQMITKDAAWASLAPQ